MDGINASVPTETKVLKRLVRDCIDPERGLGHVDGVKASSTSKDSGVDSSSKSQTGGGVSGVGRNEEEDGGEAAGRGRDGRPGKDERTV